VHVLEVLDRFAGFPEEQVVVLDLSRTLQRFAQSELAIQGLQRSRAKFDVTVLAGFRRILVGPSDACLVDR
jgi:hypothetical protein